MDKRQAQEIIKNTFESPFDKVRFAAFIKNLLNRIDDAPFTYQGIYIPDAYKQYIKTLERVGKFSDGENRIDILVITLQKETSLERARTMQRNFIAWYLNGSRGGDLKDAALAAFVSPGEEDWRFSLVKMDYKFEQTKAGRMKVKEDFTPARRWSFLVGANEKSHTAQSRLVKILADDEKAPTLKEIENSFDIETVTKEFFREYRGLFLRTKEELDRVVKKDPEVEADFDDKGVDTVNFAKKLLGQIIFLYFLQKKGWFGVGRDDDWGTGSKQFLRELFEKKRGDDKNFFNDILEPLFYEALRIDRSHDDGYYSRFNCKIPFLNGGLFDPIGNYDWVHTDILIPDKLFSNNTKTKEGDKGTGILDVFDRYNFTVKEDEPLEKEVAIDPELLGKSYEKFNAIRPDNYAEFKKALKSGKKGEENKFNKKFGVYYTPREIVHYMCQQSLINYLYSELNSGPVSYEKLGNSQLEMLGNEGKRGQLDLTIEHKSTPTISKEDIETLIQLGEQVSDNEATALIKEQKIAEGKQKTTKNKPILSESIRKNAKLIDDKLAEITVCDPAVGSGAFLVGMMSEIVRARNVLSTFVQNKNRTPYKFKRRCIEHSLYGVDIDPGAVEIAKLRLWLSLVVDEDDIKNIKPLPNLDYRIMQGNSLISEFMGISFDSEKEKSSENLMFKDETDELIEQFQQKKDEFLNESNVTRKSKLKEEVEDLLVKIFETKLQTQKADYFSRLKDIENKYSILPNEKQRDEYIKQDKGKLFKESGFDLESAEKQLKEFTSGRKIKPFFLWNLYFSEVFHNKGGFDVVITNPPYVYRNADIDHLKSYFKSNYFNTSGNYDLYKFFIEKGIHITKNDGFNSLITNSSFILQKSFEKTRKFLLSNSLFKILAPLGPNVFEESTVDSAIYVIQKSIGNDSQIKIITPDESNEIFGTKPYYINQARFNDNDSYVFDYLLKQREYEIVKKLFSNYPDIESGYEFGVGINTGYIKAELTAEIKVDNRYHPMIPGSGISRYGIPKTDGYIMYDKKFVKSKGKLGRALPDEKFFTNPKVLVVRTRNLTLKQRIIATIDYDKKYNLNRISNIIAREGYKLEGLLGILNSRLYKWMYLKRFFDYEIKPIYLRNSPLCDTNNDVLNNLVKDILKIKSNNPTAETKDLENQIDKLVYKLYNLTPEEIKIVEGRDEKAG